MVKIGLISDTHGYLDDDLLSTLEACDEIWHAGDVGTVSVIEQLESLGLPIRGVYGNIDGQDIRIMWPEDLRFEIEGIRVFITHIGGYPPRYNSRTRPMIKMDPPDLMIAGHSHILKVMRDKELDTLHMNPGAAGVHGFHRIRTMLTFNLSDGKISEVSAIELGLRGAIS